MTELAAEGWAFVVRLTYSILPGTLAFFSPAALLLNAWQFSVYSYSADRGRSRRLQSPIPKYSNKTWGGKSP
ncbi:hypothetical protein BDP81DRAFT_413279 [Colletotrichum phormii]|uniref:Uncharacterized protein n=1 Tax=Colletotrichum phormii TaxID=359342 RepID=A0AAJ0A3E2_9PEZI|nr:uncharacterized protein BDP81DRAFT_413279 [Colletotrichum phormii]KAK1655737.1 hypothetical protein BDP81DRAFT_413279 [Colletotrichum phormii]